MTVLGAALALIMVVLAVRRDAYPWALAVGGLTPAGVAVFAGGFPVPTFYAAALGVVVALTADAAARRREPGELALRRHGDAHCPPARPHSGLIVLWIFVAWSVAVTLAAPALFAGVEVLQNGKTRLLVPGLITKSNLAQVVYLVLSVSVVTYLAKVRSAGVRLVGLIVGGVTLLSFWRLLAQNTGLPFPESVFDNSPTLAYIETDVGGAPRFRGILSEPSALANMMLAMIAYGAARVRQVSGPGRWGLVALVAMAAWMGYVSTSGTFVSGLVLLTLLALVVMFLQTVLRRPAIPVGGIAASLAAIAALPFAVTPMVAWFLGSVRTKVDSTSYTDRVGSDVHAFGVLADTFGLGAGLGSERPSSFGAALLATVGLVGTVLFASGVILIIAGSVRDKGTRPALWVLATVLISKMISGPDLAATSGLLWIPLGVLAAASTDHVRDGIDRIVAAPRSGPRSRLPSPRRRLPSHVPQVSAGQRHLLRSQVIDRKTRSGASQQ